MMQEQAYKVRLYPSRDQVSNIEKNIGCCRFVYNHFLHMKKSTYEETGKTISGFDCSKILTEMKKDPEYSWLKEVNSQSLQCSIEHLDVAYNRFFKKKSSFPRFKKKSSGGSFKVPQHFKVGKDHIVLPKLGKIRFRGSPKCEIVNPNSVTISKDIDGKYYADIQFCGKVSTLPEAKNESIGIDLGISHFLSASNGDKIDNPRFLKKSLKKIKHHQRMVAKSKNGSKRKEKKRLRLAAIRVKERNQRKDFLNKVSTNLIRENQTIAVENLNVEGMLKNYCLAQAISDASWNKFVSMLLYKSHWYGRRIVRVGRFFPSSKTCSICGHIRELKLSDREWKCPECGSQHDRDINAAKNILQEGLKELSGLGTKSDTKEKREEPLSLDKAGIREAHDALASV